MRFKLLMFPSVGQCLLGMGPALDGSVLSEALGKDGNPGPLYLAAPDGAPDMDLGRSTPVSDVVVKEVVPIIPAADAGGSPNFRARDARGEDPAPSCPRSAAPDTAPSTPAPQRARGQQRCYVITSHESADASRLLRSANTLSSRIKFSYTKYITGVTFCTDNSALIHSIKKNYPSLDVEEDKLFRIGSVNNDKRLSGLRRRVESHGAGCQREARRDSTSTYRRQGDSATHVHQQYSIPMHFYRMYNMGNLIFNNYLLNNILFRVLRINYIVKYFYRYDFIYSGSNIKITKIDVDAERSCNKHGNNTANLLVGTYNSFAKSASLVNIGGFDCDGTIWLSKLLHTLETVGDTDVLLMPFSGPRSNALDAVLRKLSQRMHIVSAAGNEGGNSCHCSPGGQDIIKVGSVSQNGNPSSFSNRGGCNHIYALGENIFSDSGTSYSAALVASAVAVYLSKHPGAGRHEVLQFLRNNSMPSYLKLRILQIPDVDLNDAGKKTYTLYHPLLVFFAMVVVILLVFLICCCIVRWYRAWRAR